MAPKGAKPQPKSTEPVKECKLTITAHMSTNEHEPSVLTAQFSRPYHCRETPSRIPSLTTIPGLERHERPFWHDCQREGCIRELQVSRYRRVESLADGSAEVILEGCRATEDTYPIAGTEGFGKGLSWERLGGLYTTGVQVVRAEAETVLGYQGGE